MESVNSSTTAHTNFEKTDAQVIEHVGNFEAVARYENPDLRDLMAAHALLSLAGALTTAPSVQHDSTGSNTVLAVAASTASGSTAAPVMPIQATSTIISTPATVPVVTAPPYCGMYSIVAPSNLSAGPLVQYRANSLGVASASRHGIHSLVQPTRYHRGTYSTTAPRNLSAGPLVQHRPTNSDAASASPHGAHAHTRPTSSLRGAHSTVAPRNLRTGPSVQYRVSNSDAASTYRHSADTHTRSTSAYNGIYIHRTPANVNPGPSVEPHCANTDAAPANPVAGPSVKRRASNPQQPKRQRANPYGDSAVVMSSDSEAGEGASNAGQDVPTTIIHDVAGEDVTSARFFSLFKRFIFLGFDMIPVVYLHLVGHKLVAASVSPRQLSEQLGKIEGFKIWEQGFHIVKESFLVRCGSAYMQMRRKLQCRLGIAKEAQTGVVAAPVLYLHVVTIGCVNLRQFADTVLLPMFKTVAGCDLGSRRVISKDGQISFTGSRYCELAREWLLNICKHIIKDNCMDALLDNADEYYKAYKKAGPDRENEDAIFDPDGSIGQGMLNEDKPGIHLVIGLSYVEMLELYEVLPCMVDGMFDKDESEYLKRVSSFASNQLKLLPEH
ncbi:hypothetical protein IW146_002306 [Coemansia sp. RSA 922]|nr:hypothetical protein H4S03_006316 [Coemansia sp. S3946]KAJ2072129.1 hypothetical protein GGH13_002896 [Coemansia sp. S155-1]KAJ2115447.1 hypothetical protein IW146_002306 [Coemansia sp. RSA 922]